MLLLNKRIFKSEAVWIENLKIKENSLKYTLSFYNLICCKRNQSNNEKKKKKISRY